MMVSGSMTNPSLAPEPIVANSTQIAVSSVSQSSSPITTKAEARSVAAAPKAEAQSSPQQNKKQNGNPNAGVEAAIREYFADIPLMIEIARCESKFRQFDSYGDVLHGVQVYADTGAFQVNTWYHGARAEKLGYNLNTLTGNMSYSRLLQKEQGYWPWISSQPCWGKSPLAANFNAQREARLAAKAAKAELAKANAAVNAAALANTASVTGAIDVSTSVIAER
jgi:hypothetical protein